MNPERLLAWMLALYTMQICHAYYSCKEIQNANPDAKDGEYEMTNSYDEKFTVFCEFHGGYGYMFVSKCTHVPLDMSNIEYNTTQVLVRHIRTDCRQFDTIMEQIPSRSNVPLSIQYNSWEGYTRPLNYATMPPFLYLGFLPTTIAKNRNTQGYSANEQAFTFTNCDTNPNSYLAFFFNRKHGQPTNRHIGLTYSNLMRNWIDESVPASNYPSKRYFFPFEMHMGGCGGYAINGYSTLDDIYLGAALGIRFDF